MMIIDIYIYIYMYIHTRTYTRTYIINSTTRVHKSPGNDLRQLSYKHTRHKLIYTS